MKIDPKCLKFHEKHNKGAAYTSDGYMLPCCWMDDPPVHSYIVEAGLKDPELAVANNDTLEKIFTSDQWENFFTTLLYSPEDACYMCKKKCGIGFELEDLKKEEQEENRKIRIKNG
jgi:hypothetical protein